MAGLGDEPDPQEVRLGQAVVHRLLIEQVSEGPRELVPGPEPECVVPAPFPWLSKLRTGPRSAPRYPDATG